MEKPIKVTTAGGIIEINKKAEAPIFYPYNETVLSFIVCPFELPFTGIIGMDIMKKLNANFRNN